ncbi:MAG: sulfatase [Coraliomargarita sp.]
MKLFTLPFMSLVLTAALPLYAEDSKLNVLMISIDDLNDWVGYLGGYPSVSTPHLDALAEQGRIFANAHCAIPVCSSSRVSVMSGLAATTHGSYEIGPSYQQLPALNEAPTLHRYFKDNGYTTITGGKVLHHGFGDRLKADIDHDLGRPKTRRPKGGPVSRPQSWSGAWDWGQYPENDADMGDYKLALDAAKMLKENYDQPFFMSVGFYRPHVPLLVPPKWFDLYDVEAIPLPKSPESDLTDLPPNFQSINDYALAPTHSEVVASGKQRSLTQAYLASISFVDHCVGIVMDALENSPHADNTIVVLWSDHGFHLGEKHHWAKRTLWEESTRVPLLFAGPGIAPGSPCAEPASLIDIYPTLIELCDLPAHTPLDGISLAPQLEDPATEREHPAIISSYYGNHAVRTRDWRLIVYEDGAKELYDHRNDPQEYTNLASDPGHAEIVAELIAWVPTNGAPEFREPSERLKKRRK